MRFIFIYPSTIEIAKFCFNLVIRAAILALTWAFILAIGVGLNWLIDWVLKTLMAPEYTRNILEQIVFAFIIFLGLAVTLTSIKDIFILTKAGLRNPSTNLSGKPSGEPNDEGQKTPSD